MRNSILTVAASVIVLLQPANMTAALQGDWVGTIGQREDHVYVQARFEPQTGGFKGHVDAFLPPFDLVKARPLTRTTYVRRFAPGAFG